MSSEAAKLMNLINQSSTKLSESESKRNARLRDGDFSAAESEAGLVSEIRSTIAEARGRLSAVQGEAQKEEEIKEKKKQENYASTLQFLDEPESKDKKPVDNSKSTVGTKPGFQDPIAEDEKLVIKPELDTKPALKPETDEKPEVGAKPTASNQAAVIAKTTQNKV